MKKKRGVLKRESFKKNLKNIIVIFLIVLSIILLFTIIDYYVHSLSEEYSIPDYYFRNKIIFGTLIGFIAYFFIEKQNPFLKAFIFSFVISMLLQARYFLEGYSKTFVFEFLFLHFLMLFPISLIAFILARKNFISV